MPSSRPFYKRKRWIAAGVLWLVVAYPVSLGPVFYALEKEWIDWATVAPFIDVIDVIGLPPADDRLTPRRVVDNYWRWWADAAASL